MIFVSCSEQSNISPASNDGSFSGGVSKGGSSAKFAIKGDFLYIVEDEHLSTFDISKENEAVLLEKDKVGWGIETIFPFGDMLFLGTQSGVLIYDVSVPSKPDYISTYQHIVACDPVVTDGEYAYLTLRTGTGCGRPINQLQIIDLSDIRNPVAINFYNMTNPKGLAIQGNILYVCDDGIKVLDISDKSNIVQLKHIKEIPANDVIFHRNQLLVTADDGFYQFDAEDLVQLSYYSF